MGRDVAEQMHGIGSVSGLARRGLDRTFAQALRLVEPAEQQTGATQRVTGPSENAEPSRQLTLEKPLAFPEPVQRLVRFAELRQNPGRVGDNEGKHGSKVLCAGHGYSPLDQRSGLDPIPLADGVR